MKVEIAQMKVLGLKKIVVGLFIALIMAGKPFVKTNFPLAWFVEVAPLVCFLSFSLL